MIDRTNSEILEVLLSISESSRDMVKAALARLDDRGAVDEVLVRGSEIVGETQRKSC